MPKWIAASKAAVRQHSAWVSRPRQKVATPMTLASAFTYIKTQLLSSTALDE